MSKHGIRELDAGQLKLMWDFLRLGGQEADSHDVEELIEFTDKVRQALVQMDGGQRSDSPTDSVLFEDLGTYINLIVVECLALRIAGVFDRLLEEMRRGESL